MATATVALTALILLWRLAAAPTAPPPTPGEPAAEAAASPQDSPWPGLPASPAPANAPAVATGDTPGPAAASAAALPPDLARRAAAGEAAAGARLAEALRRGEPRAYGQAALYCVPGSGCDPAPGDRAVALAAAQVRAGLAIRSGDPEAVYHAALSIAHPALGRNPVRGAAWMLVACRRGYDCAAPGELDRAFPCAEGDAACRAATTVEDRLSLALGSAGYTRAFSLADDYAAGLESGEVPERALAYGRD